MKVKDESNDDGEDFRDLEESYYEKYSARMWQSTTKPTLGEVRSKIVVDGEEGRWDIEGWSKNHGNVWDLGWDEIPDKFQDILDFLDYTDGDLSTYLDRDNFSTEVGEGAIPRSTPGSTDHYYVNNMNAVAWHDTPATVAYHINPAVLQALFLRRQSRTIGMLVMDFPGPSLISAIIAHNLKFVTDSDRSKIRESFTTIFNDTCRTMEADSYKDLSATDRAKRVQYWLGHILPWRGFNWDVQDNFSVLVKEGDRGFDNWAAVSSENSQQRLITTSDKIGDYSYIAMNAASRATSVTTNQLHSFLAFGPIGILNPEHIAVMDAAGDCQGRAVALRNLVRTEFPAVNWNVAVSRTVPMGTALDTRAASVTFAPSSSGSVYYYYVWAGSVRNYNIPAVPNAGGPYTIGEGGTVKFDSGASYDPDNTSVPVYYSWDFDNPPDGQWDVWTTATNAFRTYPAQGTYTVRMGMSDGEAPATTTTTVTVTNVPPVLFLGSFTDKVLVGANFSRNISFSDAGAGPWIIRVNWGDGTEVQVIPTTVRSFNYISRAWQTEGTNNVTVTVDDGQATSSATFTIIRVNRQPTQLYSLLGPGVAVPEGSSITVTGSFHADLWMNGGPLNGGDFVAISWDDGTPPTIATVQGMFDYTFTETHVFARNPSSPKQLYNVTAIVGNIGTLTLPVAVTNVAPRFASLTYPASVKEGAPFYMNYAIADPGKESRHIRMDWGDGTQSAEYNTILTGNFDEPHRYPQVGTYIMTIRVTDDDGATAVETRNITVTDDVPEIVEFMSATSVLPEGGLARVEGQFRSLAYTNDHLTVKIDWGDGRPPTDATIYQGYGDEDGTNHFNASHVYRDNFGANLWVARVTITDDDGNVDTAPTLINVTNVPPTILVASQYSTPTGTPFTGIGRISDPGNDTFTGYVKYAEYTGWLPLSVIGNTFQFNHVYPSNGVYNVIFYIQDKDGASSTNTLSVFVGPVLDLLVTTPNDSGPGSLRQAVLDVNTSAIGALFPKDYSEIRFAPGLSGQTIVLTSGPLLLSRPTKILATNLPGGLRISGNNASRILEIATGNSVELDALTIINGVASEGGGILNNGARLTLNQCVLSGNTANGGGGGGLYNNSGTVVLNRCTLSGNGSIYTRGGAILNARGNLTLSHCTLTGNSAGNAGAAIFNGQEFSNIATLALNHCTVVGNASATAAAIDQSIGAPQTIHHSIVAQNTFGDVGWNYFTGTGNFIGGDPMLYPLGNYGGPTPTMPPQPGSPAIDAGAATGFFTDQRGYPRVRGFGPEIGAAEDVFDPALLVSDLDLLEDGSVRFGFLNLSGPSYSVLASTNVAEPLSTWLNLGPAIEVLPGAFQFIDPQAPNYPQRFYSVTTP